MEPSSYRDEGCQQGARPRASLEGLQPRILRNLRVDAQDPRLSEPGPVCRPRMATISGGPPSLMTSASHPTRQDTAFCIEGSGSVPCCTAQGDASAECWHEQAGTVERPGLQQECQERSLVPAGCHHRRLSEVCQQQLSADIVKDVIEGLPLRPSGITDARAPHLHVRRVEGNSRAIDVTVVHSFRAHFDEALPASPDPASPPRQQLPMLAAGEAAARQDQGACGSSSSSGSGTSSGSGGLQVEELPHSSSESLGAAATAAATLHASPAQETVLLEGPCLACRVEMPPDSPHGAGSRSGSGGGSKLSGASAASRANSSGSSSAASTAPTPSTGEQRPRQASAPELGSSVDHVPVDDYAVGAACGAAAAEAALAAAAAAAVGSSKHGASRQQPQPQTQPSTVPAGWQQQGEQQQHARQQQQQQGEQPRRQGDGPAAAPAPAAQLLAPPAAWEAPAVAAAEVQRRLSQDQQWAGLQQRRLAGMSRQDSLMPFEINPHDIMVGERLAVGGFAEVFVGRYQGTAVAIKLLLSVDERGQESFRKEVHLLERLRHPNIVLFMGICTRPYLAIVSEYMARGSLFKLLRRGGDRPLPPKLQRSVAISVARGMSYLHSRVPPLLHLDLKSPNILLDDRWRVKIADFGLSRLKSSACCTTGAGTPEWMAPEILRSEAYDERADVYSYGVVLWECLTGQQPWQGLHPMQVVGAVGFQGKQLPPEGMEGDPFLVSLCLRCMASDPRQRPTFPQILQELEQNYAPRAHSSSMASRMASELGPSDSAAADPHASDAPDLPAALPPRPALRLPAAVRTGAGGARPALPGRGLIGAAGSSDEEGGGCECERYGGHDPSPFAPSGPLPSGAFLAGSSRFAAGEEHPSPFGVPEQQQQQQQQQPAPPADSMQQSPLGVVEQQQQQQQLATPADGMQQSPFGAPEQQQQAATPAGGMQQSPFGAPEQQQQQQQPAMLAGTAGVLPAAAVGRPAAARGLAAAPAAASLHPACSITNDSPFAQLPPFEDEEEEEEEGEEGQQSRGRQQLTALPGAAALEAIPESTSTIRASSGSSGPARAHAPTQADDLAAAAASAAAELSQQLQTCRLSGFSQSSSGDEAFLGERRLSSGSLVRDTGSPLITLAQVIGRAPGVASGAGRRLTKQRSAGDVQARCAEGSPRGSPPPVRSASQGDDPTAAKSHTPSTSCTVACALPPSVASVPSSIQEPAAWHSFDTSQL